MNKKILLILGICLGSCTHAPTSRKLSESEMQQFHLNGIIHDAKICPNKFNEQSHSLMVVGPCETVDCESTAGRIICSARPVIKK